MVALALLLLVFLAIGKWYPGTGAEVLDWQPTRSYEDEIRLEIEDIDEMLEASNERRRRTGRPELTEDEVRLEVERGPARPAGARAGPEGQVVARILVVGGAGGARGLESSGHVVEAGGRGRPGPARDPHAAARGRDRLCWLFGESGPRRSTATGWRRSSSTSSTRRCAVSSTSARRPSGRRGDRRACARDVQDPVRGRLAGRRPG